MNSTGTRMTPKGPITLEATARVQIVVEITTQQPWSADCTVDQVYRQGASEALAKVSRLLGREARIVGEPRIVAVMTEKDPRR
jgi:hypothetical protein